MLAAIGPHISRQAFEVSDDVAAELARVSPVATAIERRPGARPHVDLRLIATHKLLALQIFRAGAVEGDWDLMSIEGRGEIRSGACHRPIGDRYIDSVEAIREPPCRSADMGTTRACNGPAQRRSEEWPGHAA